MRDVLRRSDPAADAAWKEREHARLQRCEQLMRRLHAEEELGPGWDVSSAARCFWAVTSQRVWDDLVVDQGWTTARYRKHITALLEARPAPPDVIRSRRSLPISYGGSAQPPLARRNRRGPDMLAASRHSDVRRQKEDEIATTAALKNGRLTLVTPLTNAGEGRSRCADRTWRPTTDRRR